MIQVENSQGAVRESRLSRVEAATLPAAPAGSRNMAALALEQLLEGQAQAITTRCISMALEGDSIAMRLIMERVAPVRRGRPVRFNLPTLDGPSDLVRAIGGFLQATAAGDL